MILWSGLWGGRLHLRGRNTERKEKRGRIDRRCSRLQLTKWTTEVYRIEGASRLSTDMVTSSKLNRDTDQSSADAAVSAGTERADDDQSIPMRLWQKENLATLTNLQSWWR